MLVTALTLADSLKTSLLRERDRCSPLFFIFLLLLNPTALLRSDVLLLMTASPWFHYFPSGSEVVPALGSLSIFVSDFPVDFLHCLDQVIEFIEAFCDCWTVSLSPLLVLLRHGAQIYSCCKDIFTYRRIYLS